MRIGIDVGGTHTDAVLMQHATVLGSCKTPTTRNVTSGITTALQLLLRDARLPVGDVDVVMIGTTHFANALVERQRLMPVGVVRLGLPSTSAVPPMADWPADLRAAIGNHVYLAHGGYQFQGQPLAPLDEAELRTIAADMRRKHIRSVAIAGVFSPVNADMEQRAAAIIRSELPDAFVSLSHEIGRIGLLERENAAIMNACLRDLAQQIVASFRAVLAELGIHAPVYISQNDGTLMSAAFAEQYPVRTIASGPTNSIRGAAFLSGLREAMVIDIGGTTSDVGMLMRGFPYELAGVTHIGGVRTNFRMPDVYSFGFGGGSIIGGDAHAPQIGPASVGYGLMRRALIFGGDTLTASDIAVAAGLADFGERRAVQHLSAAYVRRVVAHMQAMLVAAVERMQVSPDPLPLVVVGGGGMLVQDHMPGVSEIIIPEHYAVANAIGAAIAQVGGETDRVFALAHTSRADALEQACAEATQKAIRAGAVPGTVTVIDVEEVPLSYLPGNATRIRAKAVGDLREDW